MKAHLAKVSLALLSTVFLLGCQEQASSPVEPDGVAPLFGAKTCKDIPGCSKDKGGGGTKSGDKSTVSVELSGGMVTTEAQFVQLTKNNPKTLTVEGTAFDELKLLNTRNAGLDNFTEHCVEEGDFDGDFSDAEAMLRKIVDDPQSRHLTVTIDKEADGQESLKHKITSPWREDSESGNLISMSAIAGNGNKDAFALLPGAKGPKVIVEDLGEGRTEYTFLANFGIMWIRQLGFSGLVVCHNRDEVVVIVDLTPTG